MKWIIYSILIIGSLSIRAQQPLNNFRVESGDIYWYNSFNTNSSLEDFIKLVKLSGVLDNIEVMDSAILGTIKLTPDYRGAGYTSGNTPMYLQGNFIRGFVTIKFLVNRYSVTIKRMAIIEGRDINAGVLSVKMGEEDQLEVYALNNKKTSYRIYFKKPGSKILDYTFSKQLSFK